jgi:Tol biopolymer transport system component
VQAFIDFPNAWLVGPMLSPDGRYVALYALAGGQEGRTILVRRLADGEATWLAGTEHTAPLTWSPDSRALAVVANGEIKAVDIATGGVRTLGRAPDGVEFNGGAWSGEDILLGGPQLRRMSITDGHVTDMYRADPGVSFQYFPAFLPDGRGFVYSQESSNPARRGLFLGTLDSPAVTRLLPEAAAALVSPRGYLLYGRQDRLFAQRFDLDNHRPVGDPVSIGSGLEAIGGITFFDVRGDTLVRSNATVTRPARLTWYGRNGQALSEVGDVRQYIQVALSPDGQRVVAEESDPRIGIALFVIELARSIHTRLTTGDQGEGGAIWSPDSREVAFASTGGVYKRSIDQNVYTTLFPKAVQGLGDWTHDGRFVTYLADAKSIWALPLTGDRKPLPVVQSSPFVDEPQVSRDGQWLAYSANDTGQWEVYVQPFLKPGARVRVSINSGTQPRWRGDGKELFYLALDGALMSVDMTDAASPGSARKLFDLRFWVNHVVNQYDVTADGQRFLVIVPEGQQATRLTVLTNWPSVLTER